MFARAAVVTTPMELLVSGERKPTKKENRGLGLTTSSELTVALGLTKNWL